MSDDIGFLVASYQSKFSEKAKNLTRLVDRQSTASETYEASENISTCENMGQMEFTPSELDIVAGMTYLHKIASQSKIEVIMDPVPRLRKMETDCSDYRIEVKNKLSNNETKAKRSFVGTKKENKVATPDKQRAIKIGADSESHLMDKTLQNAKKRVQLFEEKRSKKSDIHDAIENIYNEDRRDELDCIGKEPAKVNILDLSDNESKEVSDDDKVDEYKFEGFPDIFFQFPDEVDPTVFFTQHSYILGAYAEVIRSNYHSNSNFTMLSALNSRGDKFSALTIHLTDLLNKKHKLSVPFSLSYFLCSLPQIVQLCFIHHYVINYIKAGKQFGESVDVKLFLDTLNKLCGIDSLNTSAFSLKSHLRKSMFNNEKLNSVFGDKDESSESRSQIISNFEERIKNYSRNRTLSQVKSSQKSIQRTESIVDKTKQHRTDLVPNADLLKGNIDTTLVTNRDIESIAGLGLAKIKCSNYKSEKYGITVLSKDLQQIDIRVDETIEEDDSESESDKHVTEDSIDMSSSDDTSDASSLYEEVYTSTNVFEIKYSKITHKFKSFTVSIIDPSITVRDETVKKIETKHLKYIFYQLFECPTNAFEDLVQ